MRLLSLFRRRDLRRLVLQHIQDNGPSYMYDVSKAVHLNPGTASWQLATAFADGLLTHKQDADPDENGHRRYRYDITYAGQLYLERVEQ